MNVDLFGYSLSNLAHRKMRSFLSILSILIGIMSIYALISFGMGLDAYVKGLAEEAGIDKLFVQAKGIGAPGTDENFFLTQDDADFIEKIRGTDQVAPLYMKAGEIAWKDEKKYRFAMGFDLENEGLVMETFAVDVAAGRQLRKGEADAVVLGYNYQFPLKIFKRKIAAGDTIELNGKELKVVGFYSEVGNPSDDANIYLPKEGFEELYPASKEKYGWMIVRAEKGTSADDLADRITERLRKHKGQEEGKEDFFVQTFEDALATFNAILGVLKGILIIIAFISVVVASVNIMNTMYTAVVERTKEIGIMKAVGAQNHTILLVFIFEAGFLGLAGGVLGVLFGWMVAAAGGGIAAAAGFALLKPVFPWYLTFGCIAFAFIIGALSGIFPAKQAAALKPVDSLRYE
ncbi:ABC transporter permease [Candidatus Woesearchaeota archaeon]|nr:ABC transporter permease [Candidatus Woesearchaeota archaeon]